MTAQLSTSESSSPGRLSGRGSGRRLAGRTVRWMLASGRRRDERGSVSVWLIASAIALIGIAGIGFDLSGQVHTKQHAQDVATQAARVGAEQVSADAVVGDRVSVNFVSARYAAQSYLRDAGVRGSVSIVNGTTIRVTTSETYSTTYLGLLGIGRMRVTGDATAELIRTEGGLAQ